MRLTIIGAGAIGGTVGAHLIRKGHDVTLVEVNLAHIAAIRRHGLHISGATDLRVWPTVLTPEEVTGVNDTVLLAVKAPATGAALATIVPYLSPDGVVVSLQNGFEAYKVLAAVGADRAIAAELTVGAYYREPGEIVYTGAGSFRIGELGRRPQPRTQQIAAALSAVVPVELTGNIEGYLWGKAALSSVWFATALVDEDVPVILARLAYRPMLGRLAGEVVAVAEADGVVVEPIDGFDAGVFRAAHDHPTAVNRVWEAQQQAWSRYSAQRTGVWRDLAVRHRRTEVDDLLTPVLERAARHHVEVPRLRRLVSLIKEAETGERALGWANLDRLNETDSAVTLLS